MNICVIDNSDATLEISINNLIEYGSKYISN